MVSARPYFEPLTLEFLTELAANNDRDWFADNKSRYEASVLEPALDFVANMDPLLEKISAHFVAVPKRMGGSVMRIYRDTRFSRNKAPYKTNLGIQFRHERGRDVHAPGFYVHIEPGSCFLGAGSWHPEPGALAAIRTGIAEAPDAWRRAIGGKRFREHFELAGESLKRPPRGFPADARYIEDIKRKDFIALMPIADREISSERFLADTAARFKAASSFVRFLCDALELPF